MKIDLKKFRIESGKKFDLNDFDPRESLGLKKEDVTEEMTKEILAEINELQEKLYAENEFSLLLILQARDAAGKDSLIKHVMSGVNPQGCKVVSFKQPSDEELDRDYLWRVVRGLPRRGEIGIFNRSHYEEVIVTKVHNLVEKQQIPDALITKDIWEKRYRQINDFERYLYENGIIPVKFFLNVSADEQKERLLDRINRPEKNWKFSAGDVMERKYWDEYQDAYQEMIEETSTEYAPWYVLPADRKWFSRLLFAEAIRHHLKKIDPQYPELDEYNRSKLDECRALLENGDKE